MDPLAGFSKLDCFRRVVCVDSEFCAPPGERPTTHRVVAREVRTGELAKLWVGDGDYPDPPFGAGPDTLWVAFYSSAEWRSFLNLGWPMPARVLDLFAENRCLTSGMFLPWGRGLLDVMMRYGLDGLAAAEKEEMRQLAIRGGPHTSAEQVALLDYCQSDTDSLVQLLPIMLPEIDLPRALLRGRYMVAVAQMEWSGVPIDTDALRRLLQYWEPIKNALVSEVN